MHGFVELQINGYQGIHFSDPALTLDRIRVAVRALAHIGTVAFCPTVVTGPLANHRHVLPLWARAMRESDLAPHLLGLHLEGPFISPQEGARGAHPPEHIRAPDPALFQQFQDWAEGQVKLITVAPETEGALPLIRQAVAQGVVVSLGHHFAEDAVLERAVAAGARACTHLGNGMPNQIHRHQNPLWWQLASDALTGLFISDGHHLPDDFLTVALRAKTVERFIVTSDAVHLAGLPPGRYDFQGTPVELAPSGRISFADTPYLAGSSATMLQCMNHLAGLHLLNEAELWRIGRDNPLRLLGLPPERLAGLQAPPVRYDGQRFAVG